MKGEGGVGGLEMNIVNGKTLNCFLECWDKLKLIKIENWGNMNINWWSLCKH